MDYRVAGNIDCHGVAVPVIADLAISQVKISGLDEVQVNRPCGTVACDVDVFYLSVPRQGDKQSVYGPCCVIRTGTSGAFHRDVRRPG